MTATGYARHATTWQQAGYAPLPLPPGRKTAPPDGTTGADGRWPGANDVDLWCADPCEYPRCRIDKATGEAVSHAGHADGNLAVRLPDNVIGIDVDDYDGKGGGDTLAALEAAHGALPPTWRSTSRGPDEASGIRLYRIPAGTMFPGVLGPGIDVIQHHHRYVVAAPSVHPSGNRYRLYTPDGVRATKPPHVNALPLLPERWLQLAMDARPPRDGFQTSHTHDTFQDDDSVAERINRDHRWHDILYVDGWRLDRQRGEESHWTRPGKAGGTSAVLHEPDGPFVVHTTAVPQLQQASALTRNGASWAYSMFGYLAATQFNGDRSECARAYRLDLNATAAMRRTLTSAAVRGIVLGDEPGEDDGGDDWETVPLGELAKAIRSGTHKTTLPTVLAVEGDMPLFYAGRVNALFGESGGGKTWIALAAIAEVVRRGEHACLVDYEDDPAGTAERLIQLGLSDDEIGRVDYRNPTTTLDLGVVSLVGPYALVVIDSTGEAMAAGGVDSNNDREVAQWFTLAKRLARTAGAPAVLVLDHIPKSSEAPTAYAIGSQRKRAAVTGASYRVDTVIEPAKGKPGKLKLTVAKDRLGNRHRGSVAADITMTPAEGGHPGALDIRLRPHAGSDGRLTNLMEKASRVIEDTPDITWKSLAANITSRADHVRQAVNTLVNEGFVSVKNGPRGALLHTSLKPYREEMDPPSPVDNATDPPRPTGSHPFPETVEDDQSTASRVPPSRGTRSGSVIGAQNTQNPASVDNSDPAAKGDF